MNDMVVYGHPIGNILLEKTVPEPSTMILLGLGTVIAISAQRRTSR